MGQHPSSTFTYQGVNITWMGHDSFRIHGPPTIYIDPYQIKGGPKADYLLISHDHFDHFSKDDIRKIATDQTMFITVRQVAEQLAYKNIKTVKPGDTVEISPNIKVEAVPAYNINKFRAPGQPFHPKEAGYVGFIVEFRGVRIYHTGDSDHIPEMKDIKVDVALLPVSGTYVMTAEEAAEAASVLRPRIAIPMHWGKLLATLEDARRFEKLAPSGTQVVILSPE
jgi:L-ascorbate metabolism protein UlaG (beta-lactamase superfamily)